MGEAPQRTPALSPTTVANALHRRTFCPKTQPGDAVFALDDEPRFQAQTAPTARVAAKSPKHYGKSSTTKTLDKLEHWLGLKEAGPSTQRPAYVHAPQNHAHKQTAQVGSVAHAVQQHAPLHTHGVSVLVHPVAPFDTLEGIALRYGADVSIVRRSNRLWPGDAPQMREQLYIPVESCRWKPPNADIRVVQRRADGSLHPLQEETVAVVPRRHRSTPSEEMARRVNLLALPSGPEHEQQKVKGAPVECTSVDPDMLSFFGRCAPTYLDDPGESGLDDLLRLQQRRRVEGKSPKPAGKLKARATRPADTPNDEDTWRPNVWKFGANGFADTQRSAESGEAGSAAKRAPIISRPAVRNRAAHDQTETRSQDAPLIDLQDTPSISHPLEDIIRGALPNSGAAVNWMRPIHWGETLPEKPNAPKQDTSSAMLDFFSEMANAGEKMGSSLVQAVQDLRHISLGDTRRAQAARHTELPM